MYPNHPWLAKRGAIELRRTRCAKVLASSLSAFTTLAKAVEMMNARRFISGLFLIPVHSKESDEPNSKDCRFA